MKKATFAIIVAFVCAMCSCSRVQYVPIATVRTDTLRTTRIAHDSIWVRDSVWSDRYVQGDTVYVNRTAIRWRDRVSLRHDTVWRTRTDSVTTVASQPAPKKSSLSLWRRIVLPLVNLFIPWGVFAFLLWRFNRKKN